MEQLSSELIAVLGVGVAVIGLVLHQGRRLDRRIDALAVHMNEQHRQTNEQFRQTNEQFRQMNEQFRQMNEQFRILSDRVARIEGKLDLFETFIAYRNEPPTVAAE